MSHEKIKTMVVASVAAIDRILYIYIEGDLTKTGEILLIGKCVHCNRKKSMIVIIQYKLKD